PPPQQPPPEQKMTEQTPVNEEPKPDEKPKDEPPKAPDAPQALGTNLKGDGPADGFGLGGGNGNGFLGGSGGTGGARGSRWGWYASQVQSRVEEAMRRNSRTRNADLRLEVRIWPDSTGRVTRAQLAASTGDASLDEVIKNEVLTGL